MHVRCPHCQNPIELVGDSELNDVTCPSCGSHFNLAVDETASYRPSLETIGHFQLVERLGMGHFGTVWKAQDTELDRAVAIKIPRQDQLDTKQTEQFLREARAAAQLRHPNIVSVHEVGRHDGSVYIVSDFVQGLTLADWLTGKRPTIREAVELCVKIADALEHAHAAGVIHRDLKPSNIMIDGSGEPHLMDFGLAKRDAGEITMTIEGYVLGTPAYMSPEQARGEAHQADRRSDVYSLGVILFELLTGERPFRGSVRMLLHQVVHEEAPRPRSLNSSIPRDVETICLKCLEKNPGRRYPTAAAAAADMRHFLQRKPITARPVTSFERGWRWCQRNRAIAVLTAAVVLSLAAGAMIAIDFAILASSRARLAEQRLEAQVLTAVGAVQNGRGPAVAPLLAILETLPRDRVMTELQRRYSAVEGPDRLGLAYALAACGDVDSEYLCSQVRLADADEFENLVKALGGRRDRSLQVITHLVEQSELDRDWRFKGRLAVVALRLGEDQVASEMARVKDRPDPVERTMLIDEVAAWHGNLAWLARSVSPRDDADLHSALALAIGSVPRDRTTASEVDAWRPLLIKWYQTAPSSVTHSAAGLALRQWRIESPPLTTTSKPVADCEWFVNSLGMTMLTIHPGRFVRRDLGSNSERREIELTRSFFLSDREITVEQFQRFVDDPTCPKDEKPAAWKNDNQTSGITADHPAMMLTWFDAVQFCNWLSRNEGFPICYERTGKKEIDPFTKAKHDEWRLLPDGKGYRLPTEAEWEYACRAGTVTDFSSGNDPELLRKYAIFLAASTAPCATRLPNGWGLFDMHGNVCEWCYDWFDRYRAGDAVDPPGPPSGLGRVLRGGSWFMPAKSCRSGDREANEAEIRFFSSHAVGFRPACSLGR